MTWNYSGDPSDSQLDEVRFLIGDTDTTDQLLQDAEINYLLTTEGSVLGAAYRSALAIVAKLSREFDQAVGSVKYNLSQRVKQYNDLVLSLKAQLGISGSIPFVGGISISDKESRREDTDRVQPKFTRRQGENPRSSDNYPNEEHLYGDRI